VNTYARRVWWSVRPLFAWRLLRLLARAFWLGAGTIIAARLLTLWLGWPWSAATWYLIGAAVWVGLFVIMAGWPISLRGVTRRMDRRLGMRDQISTAYEISRRGPQNPLEKRLLDNAQDLLGQANQRLWRSPAVPWVDLEVSALAIALLVALLVAPGLFNPPLVFDDDASLPPLAAEPQVPMPGLSPQLGEGGSPFGGAGEEGSGGAGGLDSLAAQEALDALGEALGGNSVTQLAAAALAQGDAEGAAQELRELADASEDISPETQQQLAESLREAASEVQDSAPEAAQEMLEAAQALQSADPGEAASGLESLAQLIEDLSEAQDNSEGADTLEGGQQGGVGANGGREQSGSGSIERLPSEEGEAMELPQGDENIDEAGVLMPPSHEVDPSGQQGTPLTQTGAQDGAVGQISDPLNYPWRLRGVVQRYFSAP